MKRKITLSIALVLSLTLLMLTGSDSRVAAQNQIRVVADTGVITLGPNQILRVTVVGALDLNDLYLFRVNKRSYAQNACSDGICKLAVASQTTTNPITLMPGEAASIDIAGDELQHGVRGVVLSNSRDIRVNAYIINAVTGAFEADVLRDW
jgi:hypothetical protein